MRRLARRLVPALLRHLRPDARNSLAVSLLLAGPDRAPRPVTDFAQRRVLVLAPHADDESIGCGGTVCLHAREGADVRVLVMTDGALGDRSLAAPGLDSATRSRLRDELIATRRDEAHAAARTLGASTVSFLEAPDGALAADPATVDRLRRELQAWRPELVYLPFVLDSHPDHWQTNRVFSAALTACGAAWSDGLLVRGYEVWSPLVANRIVDITTVREVKQAALRAHASQLRDRDYAGAISGLNRYRAMLLPDTENHEAEVFFECSAAGYQHLMRVIGSGSGADGINATLEAPR